MKNCGAGGYLQLTVAAADEGWQVRELMGGAPGNLTGAGEAFGVTATVTHHAGHGEVEAFSVRVTNTRQLRALRFGVRWRFTATDPPYWLVPGMFYGENRPKNSTRLYPRFVPQRAEDDDLFTSPYWAFRGDRLPVPAVLARLGDGRWVGLSTAAEGPYGQNGVTFGYDRDRHQAYIGLNLPYVEAPIAYTTGVRDPTYEAEVMRLAAGESATFEFFLFAGPPEPHSYDRFIRELYARYAAGSRLNPWVGLDEAAELTAYGLYRWHYAPHDRALYETVAFDREGYDGDRRHMHVGWVSGVPYAYALYRHGRRRGNPAYVHASLDIIDHILDGMAPAGILYGEWTQEQGFRPGWTGASGAVHTRTLGEAMWFLIRTLEAEQAAGVAHARWAAAIRSHLSFLADIERDGNFGTYYDPARRGRVLRWDGTGGMIWIPALIAASRAFGEPQWLALAEKAGRYYQTAVERGELYGAPEDVDRSPSSEDGYNAVIAYLHLYEATQDSTWLRLAQMSAAWTLTFRWTHNLAFPPETILGAYGFCTRGADLASPANNHLHSYGLLAVPEFLRLARYTHDDYVWQRTRDHVACFLQFVARRDGDFNALRGMVGERYYQTDWAQPKGKILALSHAWCVGLLLYAAECLIEEGVQLNLQGDEMLGTVFPRDVADA
jgi:hypothetical protein